MPSRTYAWTRFWCSREGTYSLTDEGFLKEPYKKYPNIGDVKSFALIADTPVLILLGEPGIGKTFTIAAERDAVQAAVSARGEKILWPDLQAVETPEQFDKAVVNAPEFQAWLRGDAILHLYLDALDECMLRVRTLGRLLTNALQHGPPERLWLRLTCRTAEWSNELETDLKRLLRADRVKAFELLPLTRSDVAGAIAANEIDETAFFDYVRRTGAAPLASRPIPLDFLIRSFQRGDLPASQVDLYERGCLTLCEESEHRIETGLAPPLTPTQRLAVTKRIAACTIFSTRSILLLGRDDSDVAAEALRMNELAGGTERAGDATFEVTEAALSDAIDTGLFTSRGAKVLGWAHHTYQEYLAARYLSDSALSPQQVLPLIVHPDDPDRKLTPQLHGVAAWLAALQPDIYEYVVKHEPELILLSDVVVERERDRALLVAELLRRKREKQIARIDVMTSPKFRKLAHRNIAEQLRPVLMNTSEPEELRELSADIAEYTECGELVPELTQIALDTAQPIDLRIDAARTVGRLGDETQRAALKPLLDGPAISRQERWLVRLALKAAWPHALSAEELFEYVGGRRRRSVTFDEDYVLVEHVRATLTDAHLLPALRWVRRRVRALPEGPTMKLGDGLQRLEDGIVIKAWRSDEDAVTSALADVAVEKIRRYEPLVSRDDLHEDQANDQQLMTDASRRQRFASFLLPALAHSAKPISPGLFFYQTRYLTREDVPWLIQRQSSVSHTQQEAVVEASLLLWLADLTHAATFRAVKRASAHNAELRARLADLSYWRLLFLRYWVRVSDMFRNLLMEARSRPRSARVAKPTRATVNKLLKEAEREPSIFWVLLEEMARNPDNDYANLMNLEVPSFPGWIAANEDTRRRTIILADRFVRECDPRADSWFGTREVARSAMGGVRAMVLLRDAAPQQFASLGPEVWKKWTPALLGIPNNDRNVPLLATAYRHAPDEVVSRIQQLVRAREAYVVHKLSDVLDEKLTAAIIEVAREGGLPDETLTGLLDPLLGHAPAREFAEALIRSALNTQTRETAVAVAATLLLRTPNESWETIWPLMSADSSFGRAVIEHAVRHDHFEAAPVWVLDESRVADLYLWLTREYPPHEDPEREGIFTPDTRDNIASWRARCLESLKRRGTRAACDALRRLAAELPEQRYLGPLIVEAESVRRQKSWQPTPVAALRQLLADRSRRVVRSETELADVITESLGRLEAKLQGETPAAFDLWNTSPYKPKNENECSDYLTRHLRGDLGSRGVILAREVEIRRTASPGSGERTDIHVDVAVDVAGRTETISVIVEVKGCWNRRVHDDMTDQLARRYLRDNATRTGVYLVCWFHCQVWDPDDYRKQDCSNDPAAVATALAAEAAALRTEGFDIRPIVMNCSLR